MKTFYWLFIIALFCLFLAFQRVQVVRTGAQVAALERSVTLKESRNQYLQHRINALTSPAAINRQAHENLDMQLTPVQNLVVME